MAIFILFLLFAMGLIIGLVPPFIWGKYGGDESLIINHPNLAVIFKMVHHWQIGILIIFFGLFVSTPYNIIIFGWGASTAIDDIMFHSFEKYFERKNK